MLLRVRYLEELAKDIYGGGKGSIRTAPEPMSDRECNRVNGFGSVARRAMITIVKQLQMCEERTPQRGQDPMKLERRTGWEEFRMAIRSDALLSQDSQHT